MPGGPPQEPAQDVSTPLVGGQDPVADHKDGGADVVSDDPEGHVLFVALPVVGVGYGADRARDASYKFSCDPGCAVVPDDEVFGQVKLVFSRVFSIILTGFKPNLNPNSVE